ncbi:serine/threonine protein kinase [Sphaeroforma arctica JP610]|uniref:Serine/threonine protein kinase n=1 Tax=Sphaeroforma arctica JP610 TaxID=667725 RepID=A0A0L0FPL4_9EUKA|nr:serine/threonine protein kinase [Sphaeroforma arctica JP610]KNC77913.1 serine/threonine protein kinase [Sphaeroforma arctica JP610]|eukprot:XP_014151815.1 serine/threonine protein kinase [Sphaeroforma arctica JP610]
MQSVFEPRRSAAEDSCTCNRKPSTEKLGLKLMKYSSGYHQVIEVLQHGATSIVMSGVNPHTHERVAIKQLKTDEITTEALVEAMRCEIIAHVAMEGHINVGRLLGVELPVVDNNSGTLTGKPALIFELYEHGDLLVHVETHKGIPESVAVIAIRGVCEALAALHEKNLVHRDIKSENVCVGNDGYIKLIDFGSARSMGPSGEPWVMTERDFRAGSLPYLAPEFFTTESGESCDLKAVDAWAFGIFIYSVLTGVLPFREATVTCADFARYSQKGCSETANTEGESEEESDSAVSNWPGLSPRMSNIIRGLLRLDPVERLTIEQCLGLL